MQEFPTDEVHGAASFEPRRGVSLTGKCNFDCEPNPLGYKWNPEFGLDAIGAPYVCHDGMGKPTRATAAGTRPLYPLDRREIGQHGQGGATPCHVAASGVGDDRKSRTSPPCPPA